MVSYAFLYSEISTRLAHPIYYALLFESWSVNAKEHKHPVMPSNEAQEILLKMRRLYHNQLQSFTRAQGFCHLLKFLFLLIKPQTTFNKFARGVDRGVAHSLQELLLYLKRSESLNITSSKNPSTVRLHTNFNLHLNYWLRIATPISNQFP